MATKRTPMARRYLQYSAYWLLKPLNVPILLKFSSDLVIHAYALETEFLVDSNRSRVWQRDSSIGTMDVLLSQCGKEGCV